MGCGCGDPEGAGQRDRLAQRWASGCLRNEGTRDKRGRGLLRACSASRGLPLVSCPRTAPVPGRGRAPGSQGASLSGPAFPCSGRLFITASTVHFGPSSWPRRPQRDLDARPPAASPCTRRVAAAGRGQARLDEGPRGAEKGGPRGSLGLPPASLQELQSVGTTGGPPGAAAPCTSLHTHLEGTACNTPQRVYI